MSIARRVVVTRHRYFRVVLVLALIPIAMALKSAFVGGESLKQSLASELKQISIASGIKETAECPIVWKVSEIINREHIGITAKVKLTAGPVETSFLVGRGRMDLGIVDGLAAYRATHGIEIFKDKRQPLAVLMQFPYEIEHIVATRKSGIHTIRELKGRRVSVGLPRSRTNVIARMVLDEYGLSGKLNAVRLNTSDTFLALRKGTVDAAFIYVTYPSKDLLALLKFRGIEFLSIEDTFLKRILRKDPGYSKVRITAWFDPRVEREILWVGNPAVMITRTDMDDEMAYKIVKALMSGLGNGEFWKACPVIDVKEPYESPLHFHPGAAKAFEEYRRSN